MSTDLHDFEEFMRRRADAASAYVRGDAEPLDQIVARTSDATFFGPRGDYEHGAEAVATRYTRDAQAFAPGGDSSFEILDIGASGGIAYWVGFQRATAYMQGHSDPVLFNLRVTEIFRREGGEWKMVHRHADVLATSTEASKR